MAIPLHEEAKSERTFKSNGDHISNSEGHSMQPPALQLKSGSGNQEYDDFLDTIDPKENLKSNLFSGDSVLESTYDNGHTIKQGSTGAHITKVKRLLSNLGFLSKDNIDNEFDGAMRSGIVSFQTHQDTILEDGVIGPETLRFLDQKAEYFERDFGECDPNDKIGDIEEIEDDLEDKKSEEDKKGRWDDSKSDMPAVSLKLLELYRKYLNGEKVNDLYLPERLPNHRYTLKFYVKNEGMLEEVTTGLKGEKSKNQYYSPLESLEMSLFAEFDQCTDSASLLKKVEEKTQEINTNIAMLHTYSSGYYGHWYTSPRMVLDYLKGRGTNAKDIYSCFL